MEILISPSILAADFSKLGEEIRRIEKAGADMLHVDVMDGTFVPNISFGLPVVESIRPVTSLFFDVHLMIRDPLFFVSRFAKAGADGITFHFESESDPDAVIREIKSCGKKAGLSVKPATGIEQIAPLLEKIDLLLVMTVEPGFGGQSFMPETLEKIKTARRLADEKGLPLHIEVDGGINASTAKLAAAAGADVMVAGSYLFGAENAEAAVRSLRG